MTALVLVVAFLMVGNAAAVLELDCSDNATCIEHMAKEIIRSLRHHRSIRLFDVLTIEPLARRKGRSVDWLTGFMDNNAFSFDWNDYEVTISRPEDGSNVLDLVVYEGRTAKDVSDANVKTSSTKSEDKPEEDKNTKGIIQRKRRHKKKVLQMIIPVLIGMKSAGIFLFGMAVVTALTMKAFVASKMALLVTVGMALKRLYDAYGSGVGLPTHPYMYSQYPIDFPSASSHAYSAVSGVSPQFASPDMYSPTAMGSHQHNNEIIHQGDATASQSQQAAIMMNSTRAAERWDGFRRQPMYYPQSRTTSKAYSGSRRR